MRTKDFCSVLEAAMAAVYDQSEMTTVPYIDGEEVKYCLGLPMSKGEHFAAVAAKGAHIILTNDDLLFDDDDMKDTLEDFSNIVSGMRTAPYMQWTIVYFPGLTEEQALGSSEAGHDPTLTDPNIDPIDGSFVPNPNPGVQQ